ncbi:hypothetical protein CKO51_13300 [Rhodopirellula sp. SM50]|nr:hypothetical protein CKO51_13300 [Rhodopirellula sp. SM50]
MAEGYRVEQELKYPSKFSWDIVKKFSTSFDSRNLNKITKFAPSMQNQLARMQVTRCGQCQGSPDDGPRIQELHGGD